MGIFSISNEELRERILELCKSDREFNKQLVEYQSERALCDELKNKLEEKLKDIAAQEAQLNVERKNLESEKISVSKGYVNEFKSIFEGEKEVINELIKDLDARIQNFVKEQKTITERESSVTERENKVRVRELEVEAGLPEKNKAYSDKLAGIDSDLKQKQEDLKKQEEALTAKEKELNERDKKLSRLQIQADNAFAGEKRIKINRLHSSMKDFCPGKKISSNDLSPSVNIFQFPILDARDGIVQHLGDLPHLAAVDDIVLVLIADEADGRNDGRRTRAERLVKRTVLGRLHHFVDGDAALADGIALVAQHLQAALPRDAGQDGADERGRHDFAFYHEEHIHAAHFFDVLLVLGVQPEHLIEALLFRLFARLHGSGVVAEALCLARAADRRTDIEIFDEELGGLQPVRIVAPHGGEDDEEEILRRSVHAEHDARCDDGRTDVERRAGLRRDPVLLEL